VLKTSQLGCSQSTVSACAFGDWVEPLRAGLQRSLERPQDFTFPYESNPTGEPGRFFNSYCNWQLIPEYLDYVTRSCAVSMASRMMQSRTTQFFTSMRS
jgi:hypothetical protein